ncbi:MAG TPA: glycine cleavage system aminomethyltransferase GcvT [Acidimicrobiales bacterium]|nr:glycine cleavage system aminomethyltransferase GcvT [Acidimicrobiales bacterium]
MNDTPEAPDSGGTPDLRNSPLRAEHEALGARLVDFGGWEMPLSYPSGTIAEHMACRNATACFDVSHLGTVRVTGEGAFELLQANLTNDLTKIGPGRAQYTHLLDPDDASVLDDIIVWWVSEERFDVMPNASNTERVRAAIGGHDVTAERAIIAVQGPTARATVATVAPEAAAVGHFHVTPFRWGEADCVAAGTGYTGEDGVEVAVPAPQAAAFWRAVLAAGAQPAGLGARDTLRLEAGLPLHGHELGPGITPLQAGLGWVVGWNKGPFRGREPLEAERAVGPWRLLKGLLTSGRRPPRAGDRVAVTEGSTGEVTSGNYSPVLERGIALAFLPPATPEGQMVEIDIRGTPVAAEVVRPPFQKLAVARTS